jgi:uncharacterized protein YajQ (UPF0234 family)
MKVRFKNRTSGNIYCSVDVPNEIDNSNIISTAVKIAKKEYNFNYDVKEHFADIEYVNNKKDIERKLKISFDYDCTLSEPFIQKIAEVFIKSGCDVWVLTSRKDDTIIENGKIIGHSGFNMDLRRTIERLGIPFEKVIFTDGDYKHRYFFENEFDIHFDDAFDEIENINRRGGNALYVGYRLFDHAFEINQFNSDGLDKLNVYIDED